MTDLIETAIIVLVPIGIALAILARLLFHGPPMPKVGRKVGGNR